MPSFPSDIETPRLLLRLFGEEVTRACMEHDAVTAGSLLGVPLPPQLLNHNHPLEHDLRQLLQDESYAPWASRAIILKTEMRVIGLIRFHSRPVAQTSKPYRENAAEMGYEIYADYQRQGYAREAITGVMQWATNTYGIHRFIAAVSPENTASLDLVQSFGFMKVDEEMDETDGLEFVYLLDKRTGTLASGRSIHLSS